MRIRICNQGMRSVPSDLESLDKSLLANINLNGALEQPGIIVNTHIPSSFFRDPEIKNWQELIDYSDKDNRMFFYADEGSWSRSTVLSELQEFLQLNKNTSFKQEEKIPYILGLLGQKDIEYTAMLSVTGNPGKDIFQKAANVLGELNKVNHGIEILTFDKQEFINFTARYGKKEEVTFALTSSNPLEGKITVNQPEELFGDIAVIHVSDEESLISKLNAGNWRFLTITVRDEYAVTVARSRSDIFSLVLFKKSIDSLIRAGTEILENVAAISKEKLVVRQKSLESWFSTDTEDNS